MKATRLLQGLFKDLLIEVVRLAKLYIYKIGGGIDVDGLTAVQGDVRASKTFIGQGSEEKKSGTIVERGSPSLTMPINGTVTLPEGYYAGGKITQSIPTLGQQTVTPGKNAVTVNTSGKYMTGNIVIKPIKGLTPSVIKKGEYVGNVGPGTYEGFINDDPYTPYYYGTFGPGYSVNAIKYNTYMLQGEFVLNKDSMRIVNDSSNSSRGVKTAIVFNKPIDLSKVSKLTVTVQLTSQSDNSAAACNIILAQNLTDGVVFGTTNTNEEYRKELGTIYAKKGIIGTPDYHGDINVDLSGVSSQAYLYICATRSMETMYINVVKFT